MRFIPFLLSSFLLGHLSAASPEPKSVPQLGLQVWTCRDLTFERTADLAVKHSIRYLQLTPAMLGLPGASREELLRKKTYLEQRGLIAYSFGVNHTAVAKEANRPLFEVAKLFGMKLLTVEPRDPAAWDGLESLAKEYDIRLAIHNHGAGTVYGNPDEVKKILAVRDSRIGVCLDVGWITAAGFDAAQVFESYGDRVYDLHFKDRIVEKGADGKPGSRDVLLGKGDANYTGLFAAIARTGWSGVMAIESDHRDIHQSEEEMIAAARAFFQQHVSHRGAMPP